MKIVDLEQGSPAWLSWRKTVITSTDCPCIMGSSPWTTAYKCWEKKLSAFSDRWANEAMERGKRLEPEARAHFIERYAINMTPKVVESTEHDFLGASLDGLSDCGKYVLEIKCGSENLHKQAREGCLPVYYVDQIQHQLLVTGAEKAFYYSYDGKNGICIEILPDPDFVSRFMPKAREFWKCVAFNDGLSLKNGSYKDMSHEGSWVTFAREYSKTIQEIKKLEEVKEKYKKKLIDLCGDENCAGEGVRLIKSTMQGRVDYDAIPELMGIDLEKYRKSPTSMWKVTVA